MPKISDDALRQVQEAFGRYENEVNAEALAASSKKTYILHAWHFVRWLDDDFEPGGTLRFRNR